MAKQLKEVAFLVNGVNDEEDNWTIVGSADLTIVLSEYPDWVAQRKGIPITFTPSQQTQIQNFVASVVLPQAEIAK